MQKTKLRIGDVVQIDPAHDDIFGGHFMVVTEPKSFGAVGYVTPLDNSGGLAYYRCSFENMEFIGHAVWVNQSDIEDE